VQLLFPEGTPHIQDAAGVLTYNATAPKTDKNGQATIRLQGMPQRPPLQGTPIPVMRKAEVRFTVAPKPISMSQDMIDAVGNGVLAGAVGLAVGGPVELLLRSNIHMSKAAIIPVKDWQDCQGGWGGTIDYSTSGQMVKTAPGTAESTTYTVNDNSTVEISLTGDQNAQGGWAGPSHGSASVDVEHHELDVFRTSTAGGATIERSDTGSGEKDVDVMVAQAGDKRYQVFVQGQTLVPGLHTQIETGAATQQWPTMVGMATPPFEATADPNNPDKLSGDLTLDDNPAPGRQLKIQWDLTLCK
jgi:hypothetical protein